MEDRSTANINFQQNNNDDDDDDDDSEVDGQIEGYNSSSSMSIQGSSTSNRLQRKDGDGQLDDEDLERILSRTTARKLRSLFEAPEFVQRLRAYDEVDEGGTVTFTAQYKATPTPTVKWFKDEEEVRATERHQLDDDQTNGFIRLTICDVVETDEGAYKCKVENREGVASTTGYLSVAGKPSTRSKSGRSAGSGTSSSTTQTAAAATQGVSTPFHLGPIAEQKSMEEWEEMELKRQPPSPLQHFMDSIRHSAKARHAPIYYGTKDLPLGLSDHDENDDVFDNADTSTIQHSTATRTESSTENAADFDNYRHFQRDAWNSDAVRPVRSEEDHPRFTATHNVEDHRTWIQESTEDDLDRRQSGFRRRRLGQLQLKHRLAIDLPELNGTLPATRRTQLEESGFAVNGQSSTSGQKDDFVFGLVWTCLDDSDFQFYVVLVVAVATLAAALNVPPAWLVVAVAGLSVIHFTIDERQRRKPR